MFLIFTLGALSALFTILLTPIVRDHIGHLGFLDHPDGMRKIHSIAVPRVGGIAIALSYTATFLIALALPFSYGHVLHSAFNSIWRIAAVVVIVFVTGVLDDFFGFEAWQKLIGVAGAAVLAFYVGIRVDIHLIPGASHWPWLSFAITVLWLVGCANAFNLIDGMDGLAAGAGFFATLAMLIAALIQGNLPLALATVPLAGCLLGFLRYNFNPASVFLGDSGSLLIGFLLGCYGAIWSEKSITLVALTTPILAAGVPLLDVALSIFRRYLRDRPIFEGDRGHIHHKLLELGLSPRSAVLVMYGICGVAAILSLGASALRNEFSGLVVILFCTAAWLGVSRLRYIEFGIAGKMFLRGEFRRIIDAETRLSDFEVEILKTVDVHESWEKIVNRLTEFGFRGAQMSINGKLFEHVSPSPAERTWELRIPLEGAQYIKFFAYFDSQRNPLPAAAFASSMQRSLGRRLDLRAQQIPRKTAVAELAYAAAAGDEVALGSR